MGDFPSFFCLTSQFRCRLSPILLLCLPPGIHLCLLCLINILASTFLIPLYRSLTDCLVIHFLARHRPSNTTVSTESVWKNWQCAQASQTTNCGDCYTCQMSCKSPTATPLHPSLPSYDSWSLSFFNSGSHTGAQDNLCALNGNPRVIWWESWTLQAIPDLLLLLLSLQPNTFAPEEARVAYVISNLTGRAFHGGTAAWGRLTPAWATFQAWPEHQRKVFIFWTSSSDATRNLLSLCQENRSVVVFLIHLWTTAATGAGTLQLCMMHGLANYIKELLSYPFTFHTW